MRGSVVAGGVDPGRWYSRLVLSGRRQRRRLQQGVHKHLRRLERVTPRPDLLRHDVLLTWLGDSWRNAVLPLGILRSIR